MWKDSETELDFLEFDYLKLILKDIINNEELLPASIGVYGDWGSGKSSLIKMSMEELQKENGTQCLVFNGWLFEGYEDAKTALMGSILDVIQENTKLTKKAQSCIKGLYESIDKFKLLKSGMKFGVDMIITGGVGSLTGIALNKVIEEISSKSSKLPGIIDGLDLDKISENISEELTNKEIRNDIREFQSNFVNLLEETKIKRLVIFIDELDRCSPDTILDTLEAIRLFLFIGNVAFIIGADERHISYAVKKKFKDIEGIQIDIGSEYLEKMIQYPVRIPRLNAKEVEFYITCLLFQKELNPEEFKSVINYLNTKKKEDFLNFNLDYTLLQQGIPNIADKVKDSIIVSKQLSSVLSSGLNGNPRHCKRFLNSLYMRIKMAKYKGIDLERKILAKIMMLEYFKTQLFKKIAELEHSSKEFRLYLEELESDKCSEVNELKLWREDAWVRQWCDIEPKLCGEDLKPYLYFTRTSLGDKINSNIVKLSPVAQDTLNKLLSKSDSQLNAALKQEMDVNDNEAIEILNSIHLKMLQDSSIDSKLFKSFIKWGTCKESLTTEVIMNLKGLDGKYINMSSIPIVMEFGEKNKKQEEIKEILSNWSKSNVNLFKVIETNLRQKGW